MVSQQDLDKHSEAIKRIENHQVSISIDDQTTPISYNLEGFIKLFNIPGLSVAVVDDFKIAWAKGYGVTEVNGLSPVTTNTLFQAASISKPVTAVAALQLVEQQLLSLDEPVNEKLVSWHVPENDLTKKHKVTLRQLLTHTAGLNVKGFLGYDSSDILPSLVQILNGESPANTEALTAKSVPGSSWSYSGGGTTVIQQLLIDVIGKPFPELMDDLVFNKIGMVHSTFSQPPSSTFQSKFAHGTYENGIAVPNGYHIYPELAAIGLWTTSTDLATLAIELALSKKGESNKLLSKPMIEEMLRVQVETIHLFPFGSDDYPDRMGLGFFLGDDTRPHIFGHTGGCAGFQSILEMDSETGKGIVVLTNSEFGKMLADFIIELVAKEYQWENYRKSSRVWIGTWTFLLLSMKQQGISKTLELLQKHAQEDPDNYFLTKNTLISFANYLLFTNKLFDALEVLKLEIKLFPNYWTAFDTLADYSMMMGDESSAIEYYKTSLELNPKNASTTTKLQNLQYNR